MDAEAEISFSSKLSSVRSLIRWLPVFVCACSTSETGFIDLEASARPPPKMPRPPPIVCVSELDCTDDKKPRCNDHGACVQCLTDGDCADAAGEYCNKDGNCQR